MIETHPLMIRTLTASGFVRADGVLRCLLGYTETELAEKPLDEWLHPDDREEFLAAVKAGDGVVHARHATEHGEWEPFCFGLRTESGQIYVLGQAANDFPDPVDVANEIRNSNGSMAEALNAMALIVESKFPGKRCSILLVDRSSNSVTVGAGPSLPDEYNAAVEGLQIGPAVGSCGAAAYWNVPVVVSDIGADPLWAGLRDAAALAQVSACWSQPIRDSRGKVLGAMAIYDSTPAVPAQSEIHATEIAARMIGLAIERDRLEAQLRHSAKMEAIGTLAGGIAHDFNNFLAVILGNAQLALNLSPESVAADSQRQMLEDIVAGANGATALCSQLLTYAGKGERSSEIVECSSIVSELAKLLGISLSKKAHLRLMLDGDLGVEADPTQLRQVIMNLMTNAADAVSSAEGVVTICTRARTVAAGEARNRNGPEIPAGDYVEIRVKDSGCGLSESMLARIYDPFYSTKQEGSGLGLSVVRGIVDSHGWHLDVQSREGEGTTFTLLIPREPLPGETHWTPVRTMAGRSAQVLVVDDEPRVRKMTAKILESAGMRVMQAADGVEAVELFIANRESIDCVLLDLNMPKLDGEEVVRELKLLSADVRIVLTSGYSEKSTLERFDRGEIRDVIQKPFTMADLLRTMNDALAPVETNSAM